MNLPQSKGSGFRTSRRLLPTEIGTQLRFVGASYADFAILRVGGNVDRPASVVASHGTAANVTWSEDRGPAGGWSCRF